MAERRIAAPEPPATLTLASSLPAPAALDPAVFALAVRRVVLDPGHGGSSRGTEAPGGLMEKELTLDIAERLRRVLERDVVRGPSDARPRRGQSSSTTAPRWPTAGAADIFVSIHLNWFIEPAGGGRDLLPRPDRRPFLKGLAATENRDSGYSLADSGACSRASTRAFGSEESRRLAESSRQRFSGRCGRSIPRSQDRGVKTAPFIVLVGTGMPAILAEVSCLSSEEEAALLTRPGLSPAHRRRACGGHQRLRPSGFERRTQKGT